MGREPLGLFEKVVLFAIATIAWYLVILALIAATRVVL